MFPMKMQTNGCLDNRKGLKQTFSDNRKIVDGLCKSLRNAADYRLRILEQIKEQLGRPSVWNKL
jgi:hypothetical protein